MDGLPSDWRVLEPPASVPPNSLGSKPPAIEATRLWLAVLGTGVLGLVLSAAWMLMGGTQPDVDLQVAALEEAPSATRAAGPASPPSVMIVDVGGAVRRPGVYRLPDGARVVDAVSAAGGFAPTVDAAAAARDLNLASPLHDGDRVRVPARGGSSSGGGAGSTAADDASDGSKGVDGLVDLNTATSAELEALPAIGPATAAKIIASREDQAFVSVDDLRSRKLLGESAFAKVRDLVTVR